ncbi:hypothetical protein DASC09_036900 [Saccharomycopsis crataegensis]|uniref:Uncharacterized protein n=1 Tax=Saccharomycopsis crataegensis TaxID=43959 RepID=A0AAV5QPX7_9ASCO|nr:hypothetical protein DASC09_036900 [Saccharomycopsis crataegensis]
MWSFSYRKTILCVISLAISSVLVLSLFYSRLSEDSSALQFINNQIKPKIQPAAAISTITSSQEPVIHNETIISSGSEILQVDITQVPDGQKVNGALVTLCRNSDLGEILKSINSLESKFNNKYHYDWVFLNDEDFSEEFQAEISKSTSGDVKFGVIPSSMWERPDDVDLAEFEKAKKIQSSHNVPYANLDSYRSMCRFESGFFYNHELLQDYEWYWRVEPDVKFFCDIDFDPFKYMIDNQKIYGTIIIPYEIADTIPTLWDTVKEFASTFSLSSKVFGTGDEKIDNALYLISENNGETYNNCHFWTNFEISNLNFYRSELYQKFFNYLDDKKGFWYERWGDAPIHSMAASLFLEKSQIHLFNSQFGYSHTTNTACPRDEVFRKEHNCDCGVRRDISFKTGYSCGKRYHDMQKIWYNSEWVSEW